MASDTILVPVEIKTLLVNDQVRIEQNFQRWSHNYRTMLQSYISPEPKPFAGNANDFNANSANNGVYLHWTLPQALRRGKHESSSGVTTFPYVPNRWLVVRYSGDPTSRIATAWVVESDFTDPNHGTAPYMDPAKNIPTATAIGRKVKLNDPQWKETGNPDLFLTAVGPGNAEFASYQPYVENVFSIHDTLDGITTPQSLSYLVAGWYSNPSKDILSTGSGFKDILNKLNWKVTGDTTECVDVSIYHGLVLGLEWQNTKLPSSRRPSDTRNISLAVGNTAVDSLTAMIHSQAGMDTTINPELLEAFQYGIVPPLDQPDGELVVQSEIHKAWFSSYPGGYFWEIVDTPNDGITPPPISKEEADKEAALLAQLNRDQAAYDDAARVLADMQWNLYVYWWKQGNANSLPKYPAGMSPEQFAAELDPKNLQGLLYQVNRQIEKVNQLEAKVPNGNTPQKLLVSIKKYAETECLPASRQLKRGNAGRFFEANNPVLVIKGAGADSLLTDDQALICRFADSVVTGFQYNGQPITATSMSGGIPQLDTTNLPGVIPNLLNEFFFLDPMNAAMVATFALNDSATITAVATAMAAPENFIGTVPALDLSQWIEQPWSPLYLMWQVVYYPISRTTGDTPNWSFDGTCFHWNGKGAVTDDHAIVLSGRVFLTPQCSFNFKAQLDRYLSQYPNTGLQAIENFITQTDQWDFLSQALDGFNQQLALRDTAANLAPFDPDIAAAVGSSADYAPLPGASQAVPFQGWPASDFQPWRSGQFYFSRLMLVDRFGQSIEVVNSKTQSFLPLIVAEGLQPDIPVKTQYPMVQTPPRALQPGRLRFDYVSAVKDDLILNLDMDVNPVCAWILPNHIDQSLVCFDNQGKALGEIYVVTNDLQQDVVTWEAAPFGKYPTLSSFSTDIPHLYEFLNTLAAQGPDVFADTLHAIDATLWTIDPLGSRADQNLSVLIGRPLALVRCRIQFELDGPPLQDPSWQFTFNQAASDFTKYLFPIRMGNLQMKLDGLLGYFSENNYNQFNIVNIPNTGDVTPNSYLVPIGQNDNYIHLPFDGQTDAFLTMLMDPRADVHAYTDILPTIKITLPSRFVGPALANMEVTFRIGPLLADTQVSIKEDPSTPSTAQIVMPRPTEQNGTWSWLQSDGSQWQTYGIAPVDNSAKFTSPLPRLRTGRLRLSEALKRGD
ncbi:hypothetical protein [Paenibacillus alginolyticus]|uniref:Uncharacterized protein n=1 Tax=Paenibacillus alginolyticus TaxID=59839 RepID=A0ABT4GDT5_9BACL|nr:hypothetical protein [Paenibacillus alginolyticus]MCY9694352.1 hypothetical protein [Paenibacillus alginolyticus]MEC0147521.1 hypothetical protein [Paenibacillus alginolyticus]